MILVIRNSPTFNAVKSSLIDWEYPHAPYSGAFGYQDVEFRAGDTVSGYKRHWHPKGEVPWLYSQTAQTLISYEDPQSLHLKAKYVVAGRLGGIMIWELGADDQQHSLVNAIAGGL